MIFQIANSPSRFVWHCCLFLIVISFILFHSLWSADSLACTCVGSGPACVEITDANVAFLGESVEFLPDLKNPGGYLYRFRVESVYKGLPPDTKQVLVDSGSSGMCGTEYPIGKRYIIFAGVRTDQPLVVFAGMCSGSRRADLNQEDVAFLESYVRGEHQTMVYGKVGQGSFADSGDLFDETAPLGGAIVVLENAEHRFSVPSQFDGSYQFVGIPEGYYQLSAQLKPFTPVPFFEKVTVRDRGCKQVFITLKADCSIGGILLTPDGKPFADERVELLRRNLAGEWYRTYRMWKQTDKIGVFRFSNLPSGEYLLGHEIWGDRPSDDNPFPTLYYPGVSERSNAEIIHLSPGQNLKSIKLKVPPAHTGRKISIRVVTADGNQVGKNFLQIFKTGARLFKNLRGDENNGVIEFSGYQEREYEFKAEYWLDDLGAGGVPTFAKRILKAEPVKLFPGKADTEIVLVLPSEPRSDTHITTARGYKVLVACLIAVGVLASALLLFRRLSYR